jgi:uncharacterized protein (DUF2062 family)
MGWFRNRVQAPLLRMLQEGLSPEGLAWSLSVGLALGIIPLWGMSTALCVGVGLAFRLNQPAMQLANYLAYPLQLALLIPLIRLGEHLFGAPRLPLSLPVILEALKADAWGALGLFWTSLWHATIAWLLVVPLPMALLAWGLAPLFRSTLRTFRRS